MAKSALIFGISGQDGAYLSALLLKKGYKVYGTSRRPGTSEFTTLIDLGISHKVSVRSVNMCDLHVISKLITEVVPDEIYNFAGQSSVGMSFHKPAETFESIVSAMLNILEAVRLTRPETRVFSASSSECFGNTGGTAATEMTLFNPVSPYGEAKAIAFRHIASYRQRYGLYFCSGILFNHESLLRPVHFVTRKIAQAVARIALGEDEGLTLGDISIQRDWGWAPEYVEAMWATLQQDTPEDYVIATGQSFSLQDFVASAFATVNLDWIHYVRFDDSLRRPAEIQSIFGCPNKAADKLDWRARTFLPEIASRMVKGELARLNGEPPAYLLC
jgi:GDPmannose 4,6-dehydratase